jgi:hypothetical protein
MAKSLIPTIGPNNRIIMYKGDKNMVLKSPIRGVPPHKKGFQSGH